jgi:hypothetical protein
MRNVWRDDFMGYRGVVMQDRGYELPRIPIPRTPVNKRKGKGRGCYAPALSHLALELSVSRLRRHLVCHNLTGCDLGWVRHQGS